MWDSIEIDYGRKMVIFYGGIVGYDLMAIMDEIRTRDEDPYEFIYVAAEEEEYYEEDDEPVYTQDQLEKYAEGFGQAAVKTYIANILYHNLRNKN